MRKILAGVAGLLALGSVVATPPASASDPCVGTVGIVVDLAGAGYVDIRELNSGDYLWSIWVYLESNGQAGLQRGGANLVGDPEVCNQSATPDTLVY